MPKSKPSEKPIRIGVFGARRGQTFINNAHTAGLTLAAICDRSESATAPFKTRHPDVAIYTDFDQMLAHDLDAVILANYFHEHAPYALKALKAGKHVMTECTPAITMAECAALCDAVEKTGLIYMLAENYPYTAACIEMARLYKEGEVGQALYAEGEYIHPDTQQAFQDRSPGLGHWRNVLPATYYCTHALAPLMVITDTRPVSVNALAVPYPKGFDEDRVKHQDVGSLICTTMDSGAIFRLVQGAIPGHSVQYRIHGTRGMMRGDWSTVHVEHDNFNIPKNGYPKRSLQPVFPDWAQKASRAGHGGGDFFTNHYFAQAIRTGQQPYLDVYRAADMSAVGIQAWRSALASGTPHPLPDWRKKSARSAYLRDNWSPFAPQGPDKAPSSVAKPPYKPTKAAIAAAEKRWAKK